MRKETYKNISKETCRICEKCGGKMIFIRRGYEPQENDIRDRYECEDCKEILLVA